MNIFPRIACRPDLVSTIRATISLGTHYHADSKGVKQNFTPEESSNSSAAIL